MQCALYSKGKVERPFCYIRQDFFLGGRFRNLEDLNTQLAHWLDRVANARTHGTTGRVVAEHFAEERPSLLALPAGAFNATLKLERRISHEGMVSVRGNLYSVPEGTRSRVVEVHTLAHEIRIFEQGRLIAVHALLEGRNQRSLLPGHRRFPRRPTATASNAATPPLHRTGEAVARRALAFYEQVARGLAHSGRAP